MKLPRAANEEMTNTPSPHPQRGWGRIGAEEMAGIRKQNPKDGKIEGMEDSKVGLIYEVA